MIALLLAAAAVYIGSQTQLPAPFGTARAGLIAYAANGDIYTADPINGLATAIVSGPETDLGPRFSRDGTHIVFERKVEGDSGPGQLYVARSDGTEPTLITPDPVLLAQEGVGDPWEQYQFSPDGRSVLIAAAVGEQPTILIAQSDGSGVRQLGVSIAAHEPTFRPPDGAEILVRQSRPCGSRRQRDLRRRSSDRCRPADRRPRVEHLGLRRKRPGRRMARRSPTSAGVAPATA